MLFFCEVGWIGVREVEEGAATEWAGVSTLVEPVCEAPLAEDVFAGEFDGSLVFETSAVGFHADAAAYPLVIFRDGLVSHKLFDVVGESVRWHFCHQCWMLRLRAAV